MAAHHFGAKAAFKITDIADFDIYSLKALLRNRHGNGKLSIEEGLIMLIRGFLILLCALAFADQPAFADQVVQPRSGDFGGGSAMDLLNEKPAEVEKLKPKPEGSSIKLSTTCQDRTGRVLSSKDVGYENCLKDSKTGASPTISIPPTKSH